MSTHTRVDGKAIKWCDCCGDSDNLTRIGEGNYEYHACESSVCLDSVRRYYVRELAESFRGACWRLEQEGGPVDRIVFACVAWDAYQNAVTNGLGAYDRQADDMATIHAKFRASIHFA